MFEIDPEEKAEIDLSTDRAAAICGASYIEEILLTALRRHFVHAPTEFDRMFRSSGPLAAFDARIRIAHLSSLITSVFRDDLLIIKDVRNRFAHRLDIKSFDADEIRDRLMNLKLLVVGIMAIEYTEKRKATPRERFLSAIGEASGYLRTRRDPVRAEPFGTPLPELPPSPNKSRR